MGQRADYRYAIPLAPAIHQLDKMPRDWPWKDDVPIHDGDAPFRAKYGVGERELLAMVCQELGVEIPVGNIKRKRKKMA